VVTAVILCPQMRHMHHNQDLPYLIAIDPITLDGIN